MDNLQLEAAASFANLDRTDLVMDSLVLSLNNAFVTAVSAQNSTISLSEVTIRGTGTVGAALRAEYSRLLVNGLYVDDVVSNATFLSSSGGGGVGLSDTFSRVSVSESSFRGVFFETAFTSINIVDVSVTCTTTSGPLIDAGLYSLASLDGVAMWGWEGSGPMISSTGISFTARNLTLGAQSGQTFLASSAESTSVTDSLFIGAGTALDSRGWTTARLYRGTGTTGAPTGAVEVDPQFWGTTDPASCAGLTLYPRPGSPLIDAGSASVADRDGTRADIGATGGPNGVRLVADDDFDRYPVTEDCNDQDAEIRPGAFDTWYDGVDQDCDGANDYDQDGDGSATTDGPPDCDDVNAAIYPGAEEVWYDGTDQNCDGANDYDQDGDGALAELEGSTDCNDTNPEVRPGVSDPCYDGVDQDCDLLDDYDCDRDGFASSAYGGEDCDDRDPRIRPTALEDVGVTDRNCDGVRDPTSRLIPAGCDAAGTGAWMWASLAVVLARRRRIVLG
jgi:hypothetical protein